MDSTELLKINLMRLSENYGCGGRNCQDYYTTAVQIDKRIMPWGWKLSRSRLLNNMIGNGVNAATGEKAQGEYSYVDSYYLQFLLRNGVIFTIICFVLLTAAMYLLYRSENYSLLICMVFIAVGLTIDDELSRLWFNPFLILIGTSIIQRFMSQHEENPSFFPGEEGKLVSGMNKIFSCRLLSNSKE